MQLPQDRASLDAAKLVDELCDQFESHWRAGKRPLIEDYVVAAPTVLRSSLFQNLVAVELELLDKAGKAPIEADYVKRFSAQTKLIAAIFKERATKSAGASETSTSANGVRTASFHTPGAVSAPSKEQMIPAQIGRFKIVAVLGQGAFGRVYKARDPQLDRDVALKVPNPGAFATAHERERFLREARAAAAIQHPNICPVHDVVLDGDVVYIVMAYIAGKSLSDYLADRKNHLTAKQAALIVRKLAQALHAAHARGIVHRDLKPANILFDSERKDVVITDFGLARRVLAGDAELTQAGVVMGTPAYMSPEQARGDSKDVGPAADIFSLGVILYELLTGTRPFQGSMGEIIGKVQHVAPEPLSKLKPGLDARLEKICLKALAKAPKDRFGSMREFAYHLGECLKDAPAGAIAAGAPDAKPPATGPNEAAQMAEIIAAISLERKAETQKIERSHRNLSRTILAVGGCLGLLMVLSICTAGGLGSWLYWRGPDAPSPTVVTVTLQNITHLHDDSVHYYLNNEKIDSESLEGPLKLKVGEYNLEGKRGDKVIEARTFRVGPQDNEKEVAAAIVEKDLPVGEIRKMKHSSGISSMALSPDGGWILAAGYDGYRINSTFGIGSVSLWDVESGEKAFEHPVRLVEKVVFAPKGKIAYWGVGREAPVSILEYDLKLAKLWEDRRKLEGKPGDYIHCLEISRDGRHLLFGTSKDSANVNVAVINRQTRSIDSQVKETSGACACFAHDARFVFTSKGNDLLLHDVSAPESKLIRKYEGHTSSICSAACSPDGRIVAAGTHAPTGAVRTWDVASGKVLRHFTTHGDHVRVVRFSPDGKRLLSAGQDGILRISNVETGQEIYPTPRQDYAIMSAHFSPGGRRAIFGLADGTIKVWQLPK